MIREAWEQIVQNQEVRQKLSKIRQELKVKGNVEELLRIVDGHEQTLNMLLNSEDAKTRKNTALLMGDLGKQDYLKPIYEAYLREEQRFVKSSYLTAIGKLDYSEYVIDLKARLLYLSKSEVTVENQKHHMEEMRELSSLIIRMEGIETHKFIGWDRSYDIILLTNRNFADITRDELEMLEPNAKTKVTNVGLTARVENLYWIQKIRTYQELLFIVKGMKTCPMDPLEMAKMVIKSELLDLLKKSHKGEAPYYFRVEMKSKRALDEKSSFVKKLSSQIEKLSNRKLINTTSDYEVELRLIENKEGEFNILLKLFTLKDERFSYRKEVIPTSIRPVNAALTIALAKEYLKKDAQILDPFCGVGTMLVERHKSMAAHTMYGLDIQEDAIVKARINTEAAGQIVHYINRDFFRFEHEYLFDEVITDMPFELGRITEDDVFHIYRLFFHKVVEHLKEGGLMILYSRNRELVEEMATRNSFCILKEYEISKIEGTYVFILQYK